MKEDKGTSWVADARKLLQDFVAPEVRAVIARLDSADKVAAERHAALLASNEERHAALVDMSSQRDKVAEERHALLLEKIESSRRELESARREILLQVELAIAKARLGESSPSRTEATPPPQ